MKSGRISPLLLIVLALGLGLAAVVLLQFQSRRRAIVAELESREQLEADRQGASLRSSEAVEVPTPLDGSTARENSTTQRSKVDAKLLEVLVLDAANLAFADANLVLFNDKNVFGQAFTDAQGRATFAATEGAAEYALRVPGWYVLRGEIELSAGRRTISLPEGSIVAGSVSIDGGAPLDPIELSWIKSSQRGGPAVLPAEILRALDAQGSKPPVRPLNPHATTDAGGMFAFRGLPPEAGGALQWSGPYLIEGAHNEHDGRRVNVPAPKSDLVLRLVSGLSLRLRVVNPLGAALPTASVYLKRETKTANSSNSTTTGDHAGPDGRMVKVLSQEPFDRLTVTVAEADGGGSNAFEFTAPRVMHGVWDLGDLATLGTREVAVLVQDTLGRPIPSAQAYPWPEPSQRSEDRSDATGRVTIRVNQNDATIAVEAFEYQSARFLAPADASEIVATLNGVCTLEFEVPGMSDNENQLSVEVRGTTPIFVDEDSDGPQSLRTLGGSMSSSSGDGTTTFECAAKKSGHCRISGLLPAQPLQAALKSGTRIVSEVEIPPLAQGEHRKVELRFDEVGKDVRVRVLFPDGTPAQVARVYVYDQGGSSRFQGQSLDKHGEVEIKSICGGRCTVLAMAEGFAPKFVRLQPIRSETVEIRLELPRSVEVELVERDGSLFEGRARISLRSNGPPLQSAALLGAGRYRLDGLPAGEIVLEASGSFGRMTRLHDTSMPFLRLVVGESGSLLVNVQITKQQAESRWQVGVVPQGSARNLTQEELEPDGRESTGAWLNGLAFGTYEVWLEQCTDDRLGIWTRIGQPVSAVLDEQHMMVQIELKPPS